MIFRRLNAKLSDIRMNEIHWKMANWRHRRLLTVTYCTAIIET